MGSSQHQAKFTNPAISSVASGSPPWKSQKVQQEFIEMWCCTFLNSHHAMVQVAQNCLKSGLINGQEDALIINPAKACC